MLITQFITTNVSLQVTPLLLHQAIEVELQKHGEPLRWAITEVNVADQVAIVEAIVTQQDES